MRSATVPSPSGNSCAPASSNDQSFAVYAHWPFCASKCPYCDFNSHVRAGGIDQGRYLAAFRRELSATRARIGPRTVESVFFGGGTPSLMAPETVGGILNAIAGLWTLEDGAEITLEANPSSVEAGRFSGYRDAGVNRISLGVQSLRNADLKALGRLHTVAEAKAAIDVARTIFDRFSFDLIYARPGQTARDWACELDEALALAGRHLSLYQLTIEAGTPFDALHRSGKLKVPEPELADELFALTQARMTAAGLPAYEISNHAAPGEESRHNLVYWRYGEYVGVGPGAHGRIMVGGARRATSTERTPERWLAKVEAEGLGVIEDEALTAAEQADEMLLMGLRLEEGLDLARLARISGARPDPRVIARLQSLDMLGVTAPDRLKVTPRGRFVLNTIVEQLALGLVPARPGES